MVLFSFETSATGSPGNYLYILERNPTDQMQVVLVGFDDPADPFEMVLFQATFVHFRGEYLLKNTPD